jgi:putative tricarboxylic transport membrane protein
MTVLRARRSRRLLPAILGVSVALTLGTACAPGKKDGGGEAAANYPTRPVELLVPAAPGGGWDQTHVDCSRSCRKRS